MTSLRAPLDHLVLFNAVHSVSPPYGQPSSGAGRNWHALPGDTCVFNLSFALKLQPAVDRRVYLQISDVVRSGSRRLWATSLGRQEPGKRQRPTATLYSLDGGHPRLSREQLLCRSRKVTAETLLCSCGCQREDNGLYLRIASAL